MGVLFIIVFNMLFMQIMIIGGFQLLNSFFDSYFLYFVGFIECDCIVGVLIEICCDGEWLFISSYCILFSFGDLRYVFFIIIRFVVSYLIWKMG